MRHRFAVVTAGFLTCLAASLLAADKADPKPAPPDPNWHPPSAPWSEEGTWAFEPGHDAFTDKAMLDLRWLNEKRSGETGFVHLAADGNSFVRGDGQPIRFWASGTDAYNFTPEQMDTHCRWMAKLGVNMLRVHTTFADTKEGAKITDVDGRKIDAVHRLIKAAKDNGIYITISPYYPNHDVPKSWELDGYDKGGKPWGALFIDPKLQDAYRAWTRELYTRKNPYTGLSIAEDPTVAILQVVNEDSMFFWTLQGVPQAQKDKLAAQFADWLRTRYGTLDKARDAWGGDAAKWNGDDVDTGVLGLIDTWQMTQDNQKSKFGVRLRDQLRFMAEHQRAFYASMGKYVREQLGCHQLLNATNWRTANDLKLKEIERWTYAALDIDAENEYYGSDYQHQGPNDGYRVDPGDYIVNESVLHKPLELTANFKSQRGHPFIVTETSWKNPNLYQTEGPLLISAYQSLNGTDAVFWFSADDVTWRLDPRRTFWRVGKDDFAQHKWSCTVPSIAGMWPAAALMYRNAYIRPGDVVVDEVRSTDALWDRQRPLIDDNEIGGISREQDELKAARTSDGNVSRAAFLVGQVRYELGGDPAQTKIADLSPHLDAERGRVTASNGQLAWDYKTGLVTIDAPAAQGVVGFCKAAGGRFELSDVTIESANAYATITAVSMDGRPLRESGRVLVQVGTTSRPTGWVTEPADFVFRKRFTIAGERIVHTGHPPFLLKNTEATITLRNGTINAASLLDPNGYPVEPLTLAPTGEGDTRRISLKLPANAMYVVLYASGAR
ncbi:MAG: hypothetical protein GC159_11780 [Phycisphaera sp.]|nr:hypothetical protein [Phycisphaera sp.]